LLADVQLRQGKAREALGLIGSAAAATDSDLLSIAGRASLYLGNGSGAIEYFERSRDVAASDKTRTLDLAAAYAAAGRSRDAVALLRETSVPEPLAYRRELLLITALSGAGKRAEAAVEARQFATARSSDAPALLVAGRGLWAAGDPAGAREMLRRTTRQNPKDPASWIALGEVELAQGDRLAAQREFTEALRLQPTNVDALLGKARIALGGGHQDEAIRELEAARRTAATAVGPRVELARLNLALGDRPRLDEIVDESRRLAPNDRQVRTIEAATALVRHDAPTAVSAYEALVPDFPAEAVFDADLARAYLLAGRLDDARRVNRKALELNPQYWPGHALEASICTVQNRLPEASDALVRLRAVAAAPPGLVLTLEGDLAMRKLAFASAVEAYAKAYAAAPSASAVLKEYAALAAVHSGERQKALREWLRRAPPERRRTGCARSGLAVRTRRRGGRAGIRDGSETRPR
jgi:tetratricopeptide (TPR) repeat protein